MATILYLRTSSDSGIPGFLDAVSTEGAAGTTGVVDTAASGTNIQWTDTPGGILLEWVTRRSPAAGWTLAGSITAALIVHESNVAANAGLRMRLFKRSAAGSETEISGSPWDKATELTTTPLNASLALTPGSTAFAENDRLVIRALITNVGGTMAAGHTATLTYNGPWASGEGSRLILTETVAFKIDAIISGDAAQSMVVFAQSAVGGPIVGGAAAHAPGAFAQIAAGGFIVSGEAAQAAASLAQSASGAALIVGISDKAMAPSVQASAGRVLVVGSAAQVVPTFSYSFIALATVLVQTRPPTAFDRMAAVLFADRNLTITATWRRSGQGNGVSVRIMRTQESGLATPFGRQIRVIEGHSISVLAADGRPAKGDTWTLDDGTILTAIDIEANSKLTSYNVTVR